MKMQCSIEEKHMKFQEKEFQQDLKWMSQALQEARKAQNQGEVPVGAVIVYKNKIIAWGQNQKETTKSATRHAEIEVIEQACQILKNWRLNGCTLYVSLEPCVMCLGAIMSARLDRLVYGTRDTKRGGLFLLQENHFALKNIFNHSIKIKGPLCFEGGKLLKKFFKAKRTKSQSQERWVSG